MGTWDTQRQNCIQTLFLSTAPGDSSQRDGNCNSVRQGTAGKQETQRFMGPIRTYAEEFTSNGHLPWNGLIRRTHRTSAWEMIPNGRLPWNPPSICRGIDTQRTHPWNPQDICLGIDTQRSSAVETHRTSAGELIPNSHLPWKPTGHLPGN